DVEAEARVDNGVRVPDLAVGVIGFLDVDRVMVIPRIGTDQTVSDPLDLRQMEDLLDNRRFPEVAVPVLLERLVSSPVQVIGHQPLKGQAAIGNELSHLLRGQQMLGVSHRSPPSSPARIRIASKRWYIPCPDRPEIAAGTESHAT